MNIPMIVPEPKLNSGTMRPRRACVSMAMHDAGIVIVSLSSISRSISFLDNKGVRSCCGSSA